MALAGRASVEVLPMAYAVLAMLTMGFTSGLLLLHWLALGFVAMVMSTVYLVLTHWDPALLPRWLAALVVLQTSYIAGAAMRVWWDGQGEQRP
jgi:hypothetical protein